MTNPLFQKVGGSYFWYQNDHLGTPQKLVDSQGNVVWKIISGAFGQSQIEVAFVENHLRFPGQYFDQESKLHYNYFRYYDPNINRYIGYDPIGLTGGINTYIYASNNSVSFMDPLGLAYSPTGEHGCPYRPGMPWSDESCDQLQLFIDTQRSILKLFQDAVSGNDKPLINAWKSGKVEETANILMYGCFLNLAHIPGAVDVCLAHEAKHWTHIVEITRLIFDGDIDAYREGKRRMEIEAYQAGIKEGERIYEKHCEENSCKPPQR